MAFFIKFPTHQPAKTIQLATTAAAGASVTPIITSIIKILLSCNIISLK